MRKSAFTELVIGTIAGLLAFICGTIVAVQQTRGAENWREGPVVIEADVQVAAITTIWEQPIIVIRTDGSIERNGVRVGQLPREELLQIVRELAAYEVLRSSPKTTVPNRKAR